MDIEDIDFATMSAYQLIDMLDAAFPHQCILPGQGLDQANRYAGRRDLIDELRLAKEAELASKED
jgi:hypothetical protein